MFILRFDMRAPKSGAQASELYAAAIEMCSWAETRGALMAVLSEHHGTDDGHLAAPNILVSAIAARTKTLGLLLAAVPLPLWDPVRLAEEMCALDIISNGRVSYALGIGHRPQEYEHFGVDMRDRGGLADRNLTLLLALLRGEEAEVHGRTIRVTPSCTTPQGPNILIAGGSQPAAARAAKFGLGFISQTATTGLKEFYEAACRAGGREPGTTQFPDVEAPTAVFVADDVDAAWGELGPYLLHDARAAAAFRHGDDTVASISRAQTVAELRQSAGPYRIFSVDEAAAYIRGGRPLPLLPLCGGLPPQIAWPYLERAVIATERA